MTATPAQIRTLLDVFKNDDKYQSLEDFTLLASSEIKDILDAQDVLYQSGNDPLFWEDGELIALMVAWKRKQ